MAGREKGGWDSGRMLVAAGAVIGAVIVAAVLLFSTGVKPREREVIMTGAEFADEYNGYRTNVPANTTFPNDDYYNFPSLKPGDALKVRGLVTVVNFTAHLNVTFVALEGFERCEVLRNGLYFAGNLSGRYAPGASVQMTFHVIKVEKKDGSGKVIYSGELLDEVSGPARERSKTPQGIAPGVLRKM